MTTESIAITGAAAVTALGLDRATSWRAIRHGDCGIRPLTALEGGFDPSRLGGQVPEGPNDQIVTESREVRYLRRALTDAVCESGLDLNATGAGERTALVLGTTLGGMRAAGRFLRNRRAEELDLFLAGATLAAVSRELSALGFTTTTCAACASGLASIGLGMTLLRSGQFDQVIAGGYDPVSEYAFAGFASLRVIAEKMPRPFARGRTGMRLGEGYGVLVLERASDVRQRGGQILATINGYGETSDAHHLTHPHPDGDGAARALRGALRTSSTPLEKIGLIVAHATGTQENDEAEYRALRRVFGAQLPSIPATAFKSHLGHTLGGAGAVEVVLTIEALREQYVPPTASTTRDDLEFSDLHLVIGEGESARIDCAVSLSAGFGGSNAAIVLSREVQPDAFQSGARRDPIDVCVTGVGVVVPGSVGNDAFLNTYARDTGTDDASVDMEALGELVGARRMRRVADCVKYLLGAMVIAARDADSEGAFDGFADGGALLATMHGSTTFTESYYEEIVARGIDAANPMLFAEGVPNVASAHVSMALGLKGSAQTLVGTRTAGLDALTLAAERIRAGEWQRAIVGATEERSDLVASVYRERDRSRRSRDKSYRICEGAVVFILESSASVRSRGANVRGTISGTVSSHVPQDGCMRTLLAGATSVARRLQEVDAFVLPTSGTWINRLERAAVRRSGRRIRAAGSKSQVNAGPGDLLSLSSLIPLAFVLLGGEPPAEQFLRRSQHISESARRWGTLCIDHSGAIRGLAVNIGPPGAPPTA